MRTNLGVGFAFCAVTLAQVSIFELPDFNLTQALIDRDVDTSQFSKIRDPSLTTSAKCSVACTSLKGVFGKDFVLSQGSPEYKEFVDFYWSQQQAQVEPHCIFYPSEASDISKFILISRLMQCPFAIKSGGHSAFPGAASSIGGVTVALERMNDIVLSDDKKIVSVGPGNLWSRVYSKLSEHGLTAIGGRVANIGVGGLTLGGGISYLSNKHGWACDNVESFEVVTANGNIVVADEHSYKDLYWALRGGGNNFGIVTKFNLFTHELGQMYGGSRIFDEKHLSDALAGYHQATFAAGEDGHAMTFFVHGMYNRSRFVLAELAYAKEETEPAIFSQYLKTPAIHDARISRDITNYTWKLQESNPRGMREVYHAITTKMTPEFSKLALDAWVEETEGVRDMAHNVFCYILHPVTLPMLDHMSVRGGNALGLSSDDGPYEIHQIAFMWAKEEDDVAIYQVLDKFYKKITRKAKELGIMRDFIYMNYGSMFQDVISSYGPTNKAKLEAISSKYDPTGVFQKLQPGYFKLKGGPYNGVEDWLAQKEDKKSMHDEL